jgi:hypothetical protein
MADCLRGIADCLRGIADRLRGIDHDRTEEGIARRWRQLQRIELFLQLRQVG